MYFLCGNQKIKKIVLILTCIIMGLIGMSSGCDNNSNQSSTIQSTTSATQSTTSTTQSATSETPYFPVSTEKSGMDALATGILILEDGYLRLSKSYSDDTSLIIWPVGYSLEKENDEVRILDEDGNVVAHVGDNISAGGGEVNKEIAEKYTGKSLPDDCEGPYWLSGDVSITEN